ncbi:MAG: transposase family protein [Magnetococcus sp. DMHC-6]
MSKPSLRPNREAQKEEKKRLKEKIKQSRIELLNRQESNGIFIPPQVSVSNALSPYKSEADERAGREEAVASQISTYRAILPNLLKKLRMIPDPRTAKKVKHKLTVLILYGIFTFIFHMASRREATRTMSKPVFLETLQLLFPELESMPHSDTLHRLLERIDVQKIESAHVEIIRHFIRGKKFQKFLISKCYPIAIDGTQKCVRDSDKFTDEWLERRFKTKEGEDIQRYVYVL